MAADGAVFRAMTLFDFEAKLKEFASNNITALEGNIQLTSNERAELQLMFKDLDAGDREKAASMLKQHGIDVSSWR